MRGLHDEDTKNQVLSKVAQMTLEETVAFGEARETGRQNAQSCNGDLSPGQMVTVLTKRRCGKGGHSGRARDYNIRNTSCDAFNSTCEKCNLVGHFATVCNSGDKKPKNRPARKKVSRECMSLHDCCMRQ